MNLKTVSELLLSHQAELRQRGVKSLSLKLYLEDLTGRRVDLVTPDAIRPAMRAAILNEAVHVT